MTKLLDPILIDPAFVPRFREGLVTVDVSDEAVLYEEDSGALHQLDPVANVVCSYFDGQTSIAQAASDLAAAYGADPSKVEADVLELARSLGRRGLFVGVEADVVAVEDEGAC